MVYSPLFWGLVLGLGAVVAAQAEDLPPIEQLPVVRELPNPFVFMDGTPVKTKKDWERRRQEIKKLVQYYAYGFLPPAQGSVQAEELAAVHNDQIHATEKKLLLSIGSEGKVRTHLILTVPDGKRRFPAIVVGDLCWGKADPPIVAELVKRGYVLAEFDRTEIVPDKDDHAAGLYALHPNADFGAMAAWAWGFHRVVDYLGTLPHVDARRIVVTGHSRGGKTALLAGALDERIAITAPNDAGCMGTGCTRFVYTGETLEIIQHKFPYWFSPRLAQFAKHEEQLPFDQHLLKALVAPRALLDTEGLQDDWSNPRGAQVTYQAARVVFDFLGVGDKIGLAYRPGGHAHILPDWQALLDFADWQFFGKHVARRFDQLSFPDDTQRAFQWTAPGRTGSRTQ